MNKTTPQKDILEISVKCNQCGKCCTYGVGFAKESEAQNIADYLKKELAEIFEKHTIFNQEVYKPKQKTKGLPYGPCIFLIDNKCLIHDVKPLHCKVGNCNEHGEKLTEWYYSNHLVDFSDPQSIREWQTRIELKPTIEGGSPEEIIGEELLKKITSYKILRKEDLDEELKSNKTKKNKE